MLVKQIITEDTTAQTIISYLRKSPKVTKSGGKGQFQNDPDQTAGRADQKIEDFQPHFLLILHAHLKKVFENMF